MSIEKVILGVICIFLGGYVIGIFCGGYKEGKPLSREYRDNYKLNKWCYILFCMSTIFIIIMGTNSIINEHMFGIDWVDKFIWIFCEHILFWIWIISGVLYLLTEVIRKDFLWGIARIGARGCKFFLMIGATVYLSSEMILEDIINSDLFIIAWMIVSLAVLFKVIKFLVYMPLYILFGPDKAVEILNAPSPRTNTIGFNSSGSTDDFGDSSSADDFEYASFYYEPSNEFKEWSLYNDCGNYAILRNTENGNTITVYPYNNNGLVSDGSGKIYYPK